MNIQRKQLDIIEEVEIFIQRVRDIEYIIDSKICSLFLQDITTGQSEGNLSVQLAKWMTIYELNKDDPTTKLKNAEMCLVWINAAFSAGVIKEGHDLTNKLKESSEENVRLKKELETISDSLMRAKERIEELEQMIPNAGSEHA